MLHILVGFSKGQIQYINMQTKEQKVFNEGVSVQWLKGSTNRVCSCLELPGQDQSDVHQMVVVAENDVHRFVLQRLFVRLRRAVELPA